MRRIGVVGDGLTGLIAALSIGSCGGEAALFGKTEPMGGLASPVDSEATWLFDRVPIFWQKKGPLDRLLKRLKVPMPSRQLSLSKLAVIRDDRRKTLPTKSGPFRRPDGAFAADWMQLIQAARTGTTHKLDGLPSHYSEVLVTLLGCLTEKILVLHPKGTLVGSRISHMGQYCPNSPISSSENVCLMCAHQQKFSHHHINSEHVIILVVLVSKKPSCKKR